ncbi:MAG: mandelate racemase/muconate lactonizing enzyme family protein [Solirubrobacteraceae bacterium]
MKVRLELVQTRLRDPFQSAKAAVCGRPLLLLTLEGDDGVCGHGEAAPLQSYDGVGLDEVRAAIEDCRASLEHSDGTEGDRHGLLAQCARRAVLPQALAAIDLALWDLAGQRAGLPVWRLLGAVAAAPVDVNATIASADRMGASREAWQARQAGFACLKLKVGIGDDPGRLAAVRATAGPRTAIRLDANGAWSVPEALAALRVLGPAGIELCEEPVSGLEAIRSVAARAPVPVAIDESARLPGALEDRVCQAVCLKIAACGGISGLLQAARRARAVGYEIYLASTLDGPLGIAAALHAAAAIEPDRPCGLATLGRFQARTDPLPAVGGRISPPGGAGLGGKALLSWYGVTVP